MTVIAHSTTARTRPLHGTSSRIEEIIPLGTTQSRGRFGRMFGFLRPLVVSDDALDALGAAMIEPPDAQVELDNAEIPAGFTYFGQFIDHDMTFDPTPMPEKRIDPLAIYNYRTPRLDLDSLYGLGPAGQPYLYERVSRAKFLIGTNPESLGHGQAKIRSLRNDLPRNSEGYALIGDPRNDENLIVAQLHLAFMKFHNAVVQMLEPNATKQRGCFDEARRLVTWHYQWLLLNEYLPLILDPGALETTQKAPRFMHCRESAYMPVEFSVAAYRFGHSMVRSKYSFNHVFNLDRGAVAPATLGLLFHFTGPQKSGSVPLPSNWAIDWNRFFDLGSTTPRNHSRRLDPWLVSELHQLQAQLKVDDAPTSLAVRNLRRGQRVGLPSGQALASVVGVPALSKDQLEAGSDGQIARRHGLIDQTPAWYYILKEALVLGAGKRLGPLGSTIVAETILGLLRSDPTSFVMQDPGWRPELSDDGSFKMADLMRIADADSPTINATEDSR